MPLACAGNHASIAASSVLPNVAYPDAWIAAAMSRCSQILLSAIASLWLSMPSFADSLVLHGSNTIGEKLAPNLVISWLESRGCKLLERKSPVLDHLVLHAECAGKPLQVDIHAYGTGTGFAELLAERAGQPPPAWTATTGPLPEPFFVVAWADRPGFTRDLCLNESPEPLKRRNLFAPPDFLEMA